MSGKVLQIRNLRKSFGKTMILQGIDFDLSAGEVYGLVGQNGAGKTTLMRIASGLMKPSNGIVTVNTLKKYLGYMPQSCRFDDRSSVTKTLSIFSKLRGVDLKASLEMCERLELDPSKRVKHLSPGQQKKLQIIIAMTGGPDLYILDEPTAGLDPYATNEIKQIILSIQKSGKSILISSHILADMNNICTHIAIMEIGRLICNRPIKTSFIVKTSPMTADNLLKLQNKYQFKVNETATLLDVTCEEKAISMFIRELGLCNIDIFGVTASNVKNIVGQYMDLKGDKNQ